MVTMRILVSGGHLTPAIGFLQYLKTTGHEAVFIGRTRTNRHAGSVSHEASAVELLGYAFLPLDSPKFNRYQPFRSCLRLPLLINTYRQAVKLVRSVNPDVFVGFGGYLSVPVAIAAYRAHIPVVIHEQTAAAGLANEFISRFATRIALSYPMSRRYFPPSKSVVVGNLLRQEMYAAALPQPDIIPSGIKKPILYITGGNQGSLTINRLIGPLYEQLLRNYFIIHQTGQINDSGSLNSMLEYAQKLPPALKKDLVIRPWFDHLQTAWIFKHAHVLVGRSGANTLSEIILFSLPSILLPLPRTHHDEQMVHARLLANCQGSRILTRYPPSPDEFLSTLNRLEIDYSLAVYGLKNLKTYLNPNAAKDLTDLVHHLVK